MLFKRKLPTCALFAFLFTLAGSRGLEAQTVATLNLNVRDMTGGVRTLDRSQFFNYHGTLVPPNGTNIGDLRTETWSEDGLNLAAGRTSTELDQFISQDLPEDPSKPGYFDHTALIAEIQGPYRDFVVTGSRWEANRMHPDAAFVQSGRNGGFWPDFLDSGTQMPTNFESYADFLTVYFDEVVYGPNAFLPINQDSFYFEVMNEPQWTNAAWSDVIEMHQVVTERLKEAYPQLPIGGTSSGDNFTGTGANSWEEMRDLIDDMTTWQTSTGQSAEFDFWTIHNYERYDVASNGTYEQAVFNSPGHVVAIMDLFETYSNNVLGDPKSFAVTEYGSFNRTNMADGSYGDYARDEQQWDLVRDIREQLLVYMDRPDRIINATPFFSAKHWQSDVPTHPDGDNVLWEQEASGDWVETIVAKTFRMYAEVSGEYVSIDIGDPDLQAVAFREGNTVRVLLNNLRETSQTLDLSALGVDVTSATWTRSYRSGGQNIHLADVDVTSGWESLTLEAEAGAVLTLELAGAAVFDQVHDSNTYYSADTEMAIASQQFIETTIDADTADAVAAKLRFGYSVPSEILPAFSVRVNGNSFTITADELEIDDNDYDLIMREVEIPVGILNNGQNDISFFFSSAGVSGEISAAVLEVTRSVGDYNTSGKLDAQDIDSLYQQFSSSAQGSVYDLSGDGQVNSDDVDQWLALRNASRGDLDVDGDHDTRDILATLAGVGGSTERKAWTSGNFDADLDVDFDDLEVALNSFTGVVEGGSLESFLDPFEGENPNLVYDPATGRVQLAPAGNFLVAMSLISESGFEQAADFSELDGQVGTPSTLVDSADNQLGWVSGNALSGGNVSGFGLYDLGLIAPAGLDEAGLAAFFTLAEWATYAAGGSFDLLVLPELAGDFNLDGMVDAADYTLWRDLQDEVGDLAADADRNGVVDQTDYLLWAANFGQTVGTASLGVPEPSAVAFLAIPLLIACKRR